MTPTEAGVMTRISEWARQRRYPEAFRIPSSIDIPESGPPVPQPPAEPPALTEPPTGLDDAALSAIATELWRARRRITAAGDDMTRDARRTARHIEGMWDRLDAAGVTIQDHEGTRFDIGLDLSVLAYEDDPAVTYEVVKETVQPTVYRNGRQIQTGKVIVAMPEEGNRQ